MSLFKLPQILENEVDTLRKEIISRMVSLEIELERAGLNPNHTKEVLKVALFETLVCYYMDFNGSPARVVHTSTEAIANLLSEFLNTQDPSSKYAVQIIRKDSPRT